jgi:hypothetical protein
VPETSAFEGELAVGKIKRHKSQGIVQFPAEWITTGSRSIRFEAHKITDSIWNKEELPEEWRKSIIVFINKKGDKTDCSNYRGISLLSNTYKILSNALLSRLTLNLPTTTIVAQPLTPYAEEIIGGSSMRISTQQFNWWSYILRLSNT